jgi:hypothetical protein
MDRNSWLMIHDFWQPLNWADAIVDYCRLFMHCCELIQNYPCIGARIFDFDDDTALINNLFRKYLFQIESGYRA